MNTRVPRRQTMGAGRWGAGLAWSLALLLGGTAVRCETGSRKPPHRSQPARTAQFSPDRTGSLPKETALPPAAEVARTAAPEPADDRDLSPVYLPVVSRGRMLACGERWQAMKMSGTTGDDSWRDFALKCLTAKDVSAR